MALSIGELVAYLRTDDSALTKGLRGAQGKLKGFGRAIGPGIAAAGAAAGVALVGGLTANLNLGAGRAKLAAQLDMTAEESARVGKVAGQVYANNWGESLDHVNQAIRAVGNNMGDVAEMSAKDLEQVTQAALAVSQTFEVDLNQATEAAGKLISNNLVKDSTEAFDVITTGFQMGMDRSGDFLETLNEYAPQFAKLGISGKQALAIIQAGLKAGVRDTDVITDAYKEFSLLAIEGTDGVNAAYKSLGLNAKKTAATIAEGGPAAAKMTQEVLKRLVSIKDPLKQNEVGLALFGSKWEDTLRQVLPAMAGVESATIEVEGATARMAETAGNSGAGKIETMRRGVEQWVTAQTSANSTLGLAVAGFASFGGPALAMGASLGQIAAGMAAFNLQATLAAAKTAIVATGVKLWAIAQWALNGALWANPIGVIILAIVAVVAAIVLAWRHSETFRTIVLAAWGAIKTAAGAVFGYVANNIKDKFTLIKAVAQFVWGFISGYIRMQVTVILAVVRGMIAIGRWVANTFGKVKAVTLVIWRFVVSYIRRQIAAILAVVRGVLAVARFFSSAFGRAHSAVVGRVSALIGFVRSIPRKILSALGDVGSMLYNAGRRIVQGLINGITSQIGVLRDKASQLAGAIGRFVPGSPVQEGPLKVLNRGEAGRKIVEMIEDGMRDAAPRLPSAAAAMAAIPAPRVGGGALTAATASPSPARADIWLHGPREAVEMLQLLVRDFGGGSVVEALDS